MPSTPSPTIPSDPSAAPTPRVIVLLCTYNEAENLPSLFEQLARHVPQADVLVVDDNSPDGTATLVQSQPQYAGLAEPFAETRTRHSTGKNLTLDNAPPGALIYLLPREGKHGLGTATRTGLQWCLRVGYDFIVNLDADLSHDPADVPRLLAACTAAPSNCDVAVGSRYVGGGGMPGLALHRRWMSRGLNAYATRLLRLPVNDCSGSYRCYRGDALRKIDFSRLVCPGYGFLEELLVALHRNGARLVELPIQFHARTHGQSKLGIDDAWGALAVIHRLALSRPPRDLGGNN